MQKLRLRALLTSLPFTIALGCGPATKATQANQTAPDQPLFELEMRRSSYGIAVRTPLGAAILRGAQFEQACAQRNQTFFLGYGVHDLEVATGKRQIRLPRSLREWIDADPGHRMVIAGSSSGVTNESGTLVGKTDDGDGSWEPVTVAVYCQRL